MLASSLHTAPVKLSTRHEGEDAELARLRTSHSDTLSAGVVVDRTGGGAVSPLSRNVVSQVISPGAAPQSRITKVTSAASEGSALVSEWENTFF